MAHMAALPDAGFTGDRIWMFRGDGSGHVWWVQSGGETRDYENDEEFTWEVVDGELVINNLPPATMEIRDDEYLLVHPVEPSVDLSDAVLIRRCDLDVPDGVRGFDA